LIGQKDIFLFIRRSQTDYVCIGLKKLEMAARGPLEKLGIASTAVTSKPQRASLGWMIAFRLGSRNRSVVNGIFHANESKS
jgi:hypothetical protein